jgi:hypothetical protein
MSLKWNPYDFQNVVRVLHSGGPMVPDLVQAVHVMGSLSCPSLSWDATSTYRVHLSAQGALQIQKLQPDGTWTAAPIAPPAV